MVFWKCFMVLHVPWIELAIGRVGPKPGRAKIGPVFSGQNFNSPAVLKTGLVGPNSLLKAKKKVGWAGPGHIRPSQIWLDFFRALI